MPTPPESSPRSSARSGSGQSAGSGSGPGSASAGSEPVVILPPGTVRVAGILVALEGIGLVVLAIVNLVSGLSNDAARAQLWAQVAYFVILGGALVLVAGGLLRGRRWARTPAVVVQIVVIAVGMWMAFPSGELPRGLAVIGLGVLTGGLLLSPRANHWIGQFPMPFGLDRRD